MMNILDYLKEHTLYLDGGMGTLLQAEGLCPGELPEEWNLTRPEVIEKIHKSYYDAGSNLVNTNTFGANSLKFEPEKLDKIIEAACRIAKNAKDKSQGEHPRWTALDIGPLGRMLAPFGDLSFEEAVGIFAQTVRLGAKHGADVIFIETMNDSYETKAALLAAKENCSLPVFVSCAYGEDGKLMTGADAAAMVAMLEGMGADAIGVNCSLGPKALGGVVKEYLKYSSLPVIMKPNAGLPKVEDGKTVYDVLPKEFSEEVSDLVSMGVRAVGGCCGTSPEYIKALVNKTKDIKPLPITEKNYSCVSSFSHAVFFGDAPVLIGERINPTGKKRFKEALRENDVDYILKEGIAQQGAGAHVLDVNVGLPEIDEPKMLRNAISELQAIIDLPLQIDTSDAQAMEGALRIYNGKAMINSVNGKTESLETVLPLAKKYGGVIVALTLDENGIPESAEGRFEIAKKILCYAEKYGIRKKDVIFDSLALTVSADKNAAVETLRAVRMIKEELGANTSLGVSNVSFGLPRRELINGTFFTLAMQNGLSAAIINPHSEEMMCAYRTFLALCGRDDNCTGYIAFAQSLPEKNAAVSAPTDTDRKEHSSQEFASELQGAIVAGLKESAAKLTEQLILTMPPLDIVQKEIIPALDIVGVGFEKKTVYLPGLLMSAEAAGAAFEVIKSNAQISSEAKKAPFVLATVKGDIHDIGKNIVKLLLENYGFAVYDLGRDVPPEEIVREVVRLRAPLAGLSALMTTTVPAMEETIKQLRDHAPWCKVIVGGAVLTQEYADEIGADKYARDAMEAVRYAEEITKG